MSVNRQRTASGSESCIRRILEELKPSLWADGGDVELVEVREDTATVKLLGHCSGPPSVTGRVRAWMEQAIKERIPGFKKLRAVTPWD